MRALLPALLTVLTLTLAPTAGAANVGELFRDLQKSRISAEEMTVSWWITNDLFLAGAAASGQAEAEAYLAPLSEFIIFLVAHNRLDAEGRFNAVQTYEDWRDARLVLDTGQVLVPLKSSEINEQLYAFMENVRPFLTTSAGTIGETFYFTVFRQPVVPLKRVDARAPGRMTLRFAGEHFTWRLPLASLLPGTRDRKTGEEFPGNYRYNPYTGDRLSPRP